MKVHGRLGLEECACFGCRAEKVNRLFGWDGGECTFGVGLKGFMIGERGCRLMGKLNSRCGVGVGM